MRRALAIDEKSFGHDHPNVAIRLNNLAMLLRETNQLREAEPLMSGDSSHVRGSADEVYVAITRARQSVAFVHDGGHSIAGATVFNPAA